ncbi:MAG TPA: aminotransferase class V-fold PLP-dependent enzyme [Steroidobacteraceae bacterium]|nr:aminotransferase class V-fold PLP-dependent enzyme [Steroidobacteraceae bacterium]
MTASAAIYLDHAASTPVDPRVVAVMAECLANPDAQANPASATHGPGLAAQQRVELARAEIAALIGATPREIIFTSGATEANNLALLGVARRALEASRAMAGRAHGVPAHLVSARTEHKSVLDALKQLDREGFAVTLVEPDETGRVPPEAIQTALRPDTLLVSLMLANNEIGVVNDVARVAALAAARGVLVHTDASQAVGKMPVDVVALGIDLLSFTAHKFYGPKGIGALYVREAARPRIAPLSFGGGHERGLRPGTLPTHQIAGFGTAAALARAQGVADAAHARDLAMRLERELLTIPGASFNHRPGGVPGLINVSFEGIEGESLVTGLPEIAVSTGSACSSATREASYVLRALGRSTELAQSSLRISLGRFSTVEEVDAAATAIRGEVWRLRELGGAAPEGMGGRRLDPESSFATGNTLLGRVLNPLARRYFLAPARVPEFAEGTAPADVRHGRAGRPADGTMVFFELKIARAIVKSARFSAYGCPHTLAVSAWLCEALEGAPLAAAPPGNPADWMEKFAVPAEKLGRLLIVEDALRVALG